MLSGTTRIRKFESSRFGISSSQDRIVGKYQMQTVAIAFALPPQRRHMQNTTVAIVRKPPT